MKDLINRLQNANHTDANSIIRQICGIVDFFSSEKDLNEFISVHDSELSVVCEDRVSYGDWQTPKSLADQVCKKHLSKFGSPDIAIEPTSGLGAFVFAALEQFPDLSELHALEINPQYTDDLKLKILLRAIRNPNARHPDIYIYTTDFFKFDFSPIFTKSKSNDWNIAIIGNPPWVTNSRQGRNQSDNLPLKQNRFGLKGIEAITGKSNFDISEYITLSLLELSQFNNGGISFLLKNSVVRNIVEKQRAALVRMDNIEQALIDASSEFNVSVDASCFSARLNSNPSLNCTITNFYKGSLVREYGWINDSFVSNINLYQKVAKYDNKSTYVWRSGIKHDCAAVLELTMSNGIYRNGLGEEVLIEDDLIYPLLKSSDINSYPNNEFSRFVIVTQHKTGDDTSLLRHSHPLAYAYLTKHEDAFSTRKSSIYTGKPKFCIFGVGEYSFKPYKIAVSALYKTINFILVSQYEGKPVMVDDTCYQLGFDNMVEAECILNAIKSDEIQTLISALSFSDAKRVVTKSLLMRLDLALFCREKGYAFEPQRPRDRAWRQLSLFD